MGCQQSSGIVNPSSPIPENSHEAANNSQLRQAKAKATIPEQPVPKNHVKQTKIETKKGIQQNSNVRNSQSHLNKIANTTIQKNNLNKVDHAQHVASPSVNSIDKKKSQSKKDSKSNKNPVKQPVPTKKNSNEETIKKLSKQGDAFLAQGREEQALKQFVDCLTLEEDLYGKDSIKLCKTLHKIANIKKSQGEQDESIEYNLRILKIYQKQGKGETEQAAHLLYQIGQSFQQRDQYQKATQPYQKAYKIFKKLSLGNNVNQALSMLANIYQLNNDTEKAVDCYIRMFEFYKDNNTEGIPVMFKVLESNLQRFDKSDMIPVLKKKYFQKVDPKNSIDKKKSQSKKDSKSNKNQVKQPVPTKKNSNEETIKKLSKQGDAFLAQGREEQALKQFVDCLTLEEDLYGKDSIKLCKTLHKIANIKKSKASQGEEDESIEYNLRILTIYQKQGKGETEQTAKLTQDIGQSFLQNGQFQKGIFYFQKAQTIFKKLSSDSNLNIILAFLASTYQMNNNTEKAADYYIKMFELYKKNNKQGITEMFKFLESNLQRIDKSDMIPALKKKYFPQK